MKTFTISALILGVALCVPIGANASELPALVHKHHANHQVVYLSIPPNATALAPAVKPVDDDSDGLTRNIDECNRGCIGSN